MEAVNILNKEDAEYYTACIGLQLFTWVEMFLVYLKDQLFSLLM